MASWNIYTLIVTLWICGLEGDQVSAQSRFSSRMSPTTRGSQPRTACSVQDLMTCWFPCYGKQCPSYPRARCTAIRMGCECRAAWFLGGREVDCHEPAPPVCPADKPAVSCVNNPCFHTYCLGYPDAECRPDYCGGCRVNFFIHGHPVMCQGSRTEFPQLVQRPPITPIRPKVVPAGPKTQLPETAGPKTQLPETQPKKQTTGERKTNLLNKIKSLSQKIFSKKSKKILGAATSPKFIGQPESVNDPLGLQGNPNAGRPVEARPMVRGPIERPQIGGLIEGPKIRGPIEGPQFGGPKIGGQIGDRQMGGKIGGPPIGGGPSSSNRLFSGQSVGQGQRDTQAGQPPITGLFSNLRGQGGQSPGQGQRDTQAGQPPITGLFSNLRGQGGQSAGQGPRDTQAGQRPTTGLFSNLRGQGGQSAGQGPRDGPAGERPITGLFSNLRGQGGQSAGQGPRDGPAGQRPITGELATDTGKTVESSGRQGSLVLPQIDTHVLEILQNETCNPRYGVADCREDPCHDQTCSVVGAVCRPSRCGACHANWFLGNKEVDCSPECSGGMKKVRCMFNPCTRFSCPAFPSAVCKVNRCRTCKAEWLVGGVPVNCNIEKQDCPPDKVRSCPKCWISKCPSDLSARCRVTGCTDKCGMEFYKVVNGAVQIVDCKVRGMFRSRRLRGSRRRSRD